MGPCFSEDSANTHPIYENTDFDHPPNTKNDSPSHVYQNMDFDELEKSKKSRKCKQDEDEEYINPEEFVREDGKGVKSASISSKQGNRFCTSILY